MQATPHKRMFKKWCTKYSDLWQQKPLDNNATIMHHTLDLQNYTIGSQFNSLCNSTGLQVFL
jgi:hypothetical protein